ncbi:MULTISPECIES: hypothetical protein [Acidiphilium]|uniref:hypothetical protein n=1 Tax=Acidiphilium TaxID=522 RepID=UPI00049420D8|nr:MULTISPECIES: hypothetical protein [Acidiphilium]
MAEGSLVVVATEFVFSVLYNESYEFFQMLVWNFLHFTDSDSALIVNLGKSTEIPDELEISERVHIIRGGQRAAWGHTLLNGHIESFRYAELIFPNFGWFVPIASNSLFFRRFEPDLARARLVESIQEDSYRCTTWKELPNEWHWPKLRGFAAAGARLHERWGIDRLVGDQIEGFIASRADWGLVAEIHEDLLNYWQGLRAPLEEILPGTVIDLIGTGQRTTLCKMFWKNDFKEKGLVQFSDLLDSKRLSPNICLLKWFRRDPNAPETILVATPLGQSLIEELRTESSYTIKTRIFIFLTYIHDAFEQTKVECDFYNCAPFPPITWETVAVRQQCSLYGTQRFDESAPFLFFENTGERLQITIELEADGRVKAACWPLQGTGEANLISYLYLPLNDRNRHEQRVLQLSCHMDFCLAKLVLNNCVIFQDCIQMVKPMTISEKNGATVALFAIHDNGSQLYLGIPLVYHLKIDMILKELIFNVL